MYRLGYRQWCLSCWDELWETESWLQRFLQIKTFEGALGGILGAILVTIIFMMFDRTVALPYGIYKMSVFAIFFSIAGQFGDLLESSIKRHFGVKDSGKFIPGHGGVLDRFDSMLLVFPIMHLFGLF